jgi:hypothetical protein
MIWFFERHPHRLHYEIRHQADGHDYELVITHPDGRQDLERFADTRAVIERSAALQHKLAAAGWHPPQPRLHRRRSASA